MKTIISSLVAVALCATATAKDKATVPNATLADFKLGELVSGPSVDLGSTGGKAVVIEQWGVKCPPCVASLPHIEKLANRNKKDTIFIGAEVQGSSDDDIKALVKKNKLSYTIVKGMTGPSYSKGIPNAMVFDTTGKLIFTGHPSSADFEKAVRKAGTPAASK